MDEMEYMFDGKFKGNILIVGRTGCGKTTFVQNVGKNGLFGDVSTVFWISRFLFLRIEKKKLRTISKIKKYFSIIQKTLMILTI